MVGLSGCSIFPSLLDTGVLWNSTVNTLIGYVHIQTVYMHISYLNLNRCLLILPAVWVVEIFKSIVTLTKKLILLPINTLGVLT